MKISEKKFTLTPSRIDEFVKDLDDKQPNSMIGQDVKQVINELKRHHEGAMKRSKNVEANKSPPNQNSLPYRHHDHVASDSRIGTTTYAQIVKSKVRQDVKSTLPPLPQVSTSSHMALNSANFPPLTENFKEVDQINLGNKVNEKSNQRNKSNGSMKASYSATFRKNLRK